MSLSYNEASSVVNYVNYGIYDSNGNLEVNYSGEDGVYNNYADNFYGQIIFAKYWDYVYNPLGYWESSSQSGGHATNFNFDCQEEVNLYYYF